MLGVPLGTVKGRMRLGLEKIRGRAGGGTGMNETDHERWSEDLAAYMLGALEPDEAADAGAPPRGLRALPRGDALAGGRRSHALPESVERPGAAAAAARAADGRGAGRRSRRERRSAERPRAGASPLGDARAAGRSPGSPLVALVVAAVVGYEIGDGGSSEGGRRSTVVAGKRPAGHREDGQRRRRRHAAARQRRPAARRQGARGLGASATARSKRCRRCSSPTATVRRDDDDRRHGAASKR